MGYCIQPTKIQFFLAKEFHQQAFEAIQTLFTEEALKKTYGGKHCPNDPSQWHYSWVHNQTALEAQNLKEMLEEWRWRPSFDENGNINNLTFIGEKQGDCNKMFELIAPFVKEDSFIDFVGEDGCAWTWTFKNKSFKSEWKKPVDNGWLDLWKTI